ncbi:MAG: helix-turn-helix transcriptional regulator [Gammaproteobacteria bacterium]|nr:helix-turn-helix transcriptional regulator [Gammaproteobacteria bacterium]
MTLITSEQIKACRAILGWSIKELSEQSGVSISTLKRIEQRSGYPHCRIENIEQIRATFENTDRVHLPDSRTVVIIYLDDKAIIE